MKEYCINSSCSLADHCMRFQKWKDEESNFIKVVNPKKVTGDSTCTFFMDNTDTRFAKGFIKFLTTLPRTTEDKFRSAMISHYPRNKYFKLRKGEILCSPSDQEFIIALLTKLSLPTDNVFDEWVEKEDW